MLPAVLLRRDEGRKSGGAARHGRAVDAYRAKASRTSRGAVGPLTMWSRARRAAPATRGGSTTYVDSACRTCSSSSSSELAATQEPVSKRPPLDPHGERG